MLKSNKTTFILVSSPGWRPIWGCTTPVACTTCTECLPWFRPLPPPFTPRWPPWASTNPSCRTFSRPWWAPTEPRPKSWAWVSMSGIYAPVGVNTFWTRFPFSVSRRVLAGTLLRRRATNCLASLSHCSLPSEVVFWQVWQLKLSCKFNIVVPNVLKTQKQVPFWSTPTSGTWRRTNITRTSTTGKFRLPRTRRNS